MFSRKMAYIAYVIHEVGIVKGAQKKGVKTFQESGKKNSKRVIFPRVDIIIASMLTPVADRMINSTTVLNQI
jgi:hypothetical protein